MKGIMRVVISALLLILALHFILESVNFRKYINLSPNAEHFEDDGESAPTAISKAEVELLKAKKELDKVKKEKALLKSNEKGAEKPDDHVKTGDDDGTKEGFCSPYTDTMYRTKKELVDFINCREPAVVGANQYPFTENDANFQSDAMNLNRFYRQNINETPTDNQIATRNRDQLAKPMLPPRPQTQQGQLGVAPASMASLSGDALEKTGVGYSLQPNTWQYQDELPMNGGAILPGITGYDSLADQYSVFNNASPINGCDPPERGANVNDDLRMGLGVLNSGRRGRT